MKYLLLVSTFLYSSVILLSQQNIGSTLEQVKENTTYKNTKTYSNTGYSNQGDLVYTVFGNMFELSTFYKKGVCTTEANVLNSNTQLELIKTINDKDYTKIADNKWVGVNKNGFGFKLDLIKLDDGRFAFISQGHTK